MSTNSFPKNEPLYMNIIYWVGIICLIIRIFGFPIFNNQLDKIFGIIGFGTMSLFFIRSIIYNRKNKIN
ncbi:hypothetical protein MHL31_05525 [Lutibacter sp. A80]|uniref:hypothetical protein n=1 Tax=Lutibacter sp. A80 TaxID=2918453 RepID=UPI001F065694|nr:hypothetical protein [Lutibacter sp. A80]UMB61665.1 hypothetical protein MHL31_05525 [Lutibacter sp. A80]